jgi:hypothetical protein
MWAAGAARALNRALVGIKSCAKKYQPELSVDQVSHLALLRSKLRQHNISELLGHVLAGMPAAPGSAVEVRLRKTYTGTRVAVTVQTASSDRLRLPHGSQVHQPHGVRNELAHYGILS